MTGCKTRIDEQTASRQYKSPCQGCIDSDFLLRSQLYLTSNKVWSLDIHNPSSLYIFDVGWRDFLNNIQKILKGPQTFELTNLCKKIYVITHYVNYTLGLYIIPRMEERFGGCCIPIFTASLKLRSVEFLIQQCSISSSLTRPVPSSQSDRKANKHYILFIWSWNQNEQHGYYIFHITENMPLVVNAQEHLPEVSALQKVSMDGCASPATKSESIQSSKKLETPEGMIIPKL